MSDSKLMKKEPWVKLPNGRELARWRREDEIVYNQNNRQREKALFYQRAFDFLTENRVRGDYHEYGCHRCRTFRMALTEARRHALADMKFWAFDSFEGLPDTHGSGISVDIWKKGALATSEADFMAMVRKHGIYADRVRTVKGFYADSLTPALSREMASENKIALATVDCDLYESAVPVFEFIEPLLQEGSLIYLDDLFAGYKGVPTKGVARAFLEFQRKSRWKFARHLDIGWWGRSYLAYEGDALDGTL